MAIELKMPALSPTMEKGNLAKWLVSEGDAIKPGDLIAEIETDKATMEFEAVDEGVIVKLIIPSGTEDVGVGTVIAVMTEVDEAAPLHDKAETVPVTARKIASPPKPAAGAVALCETIVTPAAVQRTPADGIMASPLARRIATARNIDLNAIIGSGPKGRVVRADLAIASLIEQPGEATTAPAHTTAQSIPAVTIAPPPQDVPFETLKLGSMRKTIARRLTEAKQTVPHFYLTARCNIDALLRLRTELNEAIAPRGIKLSVNDMVIKAMALALCKVPDANVQFGGDVLHRFGRVDIAMAVAIEGGLVTPVIKGADTQSLSAIAQASKALAQKARDGKLTPDDYQGGTASISNLGMFGIDEMFPVINPPQAMILGVGTGVEMPWKVDGAIGLATIMAATASFDHRAIDGAVAAQFMQALREHLEAPMQLLV